MFSVDHHGNNTKRRRRGGTRFSLSLLSLSGPAPKKGPESINWNSISRASSSLKVDSGICISKMGKQNRFSKRAFEIMHTHYIARRPTRLKKQQAPSPHALHCRVLDRLLSSLRLFHLHNYFFSKTNTRSINKKRRRALFKDEREREKCVVRARVRRLIKAGGGVRFLRQNSSINQATRNKNNKRNGSDRETTASRVQMQ